MTEILLVVVGVLVVIAGGAALVLATRNRPGDRTGPALPDQQPGAGDQPEAASRPAPTATLPGRPDADTDAPPGAPDTAEAVAPRRRFAERLTRSRNALSQGLTGLFSRGVGDEAAWDDLEEALLTADIGVATTTELIERLRSRARAEHAQGEQLRALLREELLAAVDPKQDRTLSLDTLPDDQRPGIVLVVGVNGTGKTTTAGKLALAFAEEGKQPVLAAADTFRAAAGDQLAIWGERTGAPVIRQPQGADAASVAFDALASARARHADVVLVDTAGRLHTKTNLMEELKKIRRVLEREGGTIAEVLLVLDATTGQNGLTQARQFTEAVTVTGLVLTKLDGTARGGIVVAVQRELGIPVKLIGLGEGVRDLAPFDPEAFVDALLSDPATDGLPPTQDRDDT